jgi:hypothetical protein
MLTFGTVKNAAILQAIPEPFRFQQDRQQFNRPAIARSQVNKAVSDRFPFTLSH